MNRRKGYHQRKHKRTSKLGKRFRVGRGKHYTKEEVERETDKDFEKYNRLYGAKPINGWLFDSTGLGGGGWDFQHYFKTGKWRTDKSWRPAIFFSSKNIIDGDFLYITIEHSPQGWVFLHMDGRPVLIGSKQKAVKYLLNFMKKNSPREYYKRYY